MRVAVTIPIALLASLTIPPTTKVVTNDRTDIHLIVFVPCAASGVGENLDLSGPLHTLISLTINANNASGYFHFQPQGISGTGETTGARHTATGGAPNSPLGVRAIWQAEGSTGRLTAFFRHCSACGGCQSSAAGRLEADRTYVDEKSAGAIPVRKIGRCVRW